MALLRGILILEPHNFMGRSDGIVSAPTLIQTQERNDFEENEYFEGLSLQLCMRKFNQ